MRRLRVTRRRGQLVWAGMTVSILANGWRLRSRLAHLGVLRSDVRAPRVPGPSEVGTWAVVTGAGVTLDDVTRQAAIAHAETHQLDVLDLVPGDLPVGPLLDLARLVNPKTYRQDALAAGRGTGQATIVRSSVLDRLGCHHHEDLDPVEYLELMVDLKRFAPTTTDLLVAPDLQYVDPDIGWRRPQMRALYGSVMPAFAAGPLVSGAVLSAGPRLGRRWGIAALAAFAAQPYIATAGGPIRPRDRGVVAAIGRVGRNAATMAQALFTPLPATAHQRSQQAADEQRASRETYAELLVDAPGFFEPRRSTCPWCDGRDLRRVVSVPDLLQGKPGLFHLDECRACRHIFQNPRLSPQGLDFYYRDFYDGLQSEEAEFVFSTGGRSYLGRAEMLQGVATPKRWLDVGAGHGHFCLVAKQTWPETQFDGLDMSSSIVEARRRGWVEQGYEGLLTDLAADLTGAYDVVSMHHCLEHTRDPRTELRAAHTVLEEGGHLLIEVPDPESRLGRRLGWLWGPWFQPQHQHFVPLDNLTVALEEQGFTVVAAERGRPHQPVDLAFALWLLANRIAPAGGRPWESEPTVARRVGRAATFTAFGPFLVAALAIDLAMAPLMRRIPRLSNTYRVLARKEQSE